MNAHLEIVKYPHPILKHKSKPLIRIDKQIKDWVAEMFTLMYANNGIGLAANQVGLPYQFFVMNTTGDRTKTECEHVFINPVLRKRHGSETDEEGCLSFPEIVADVVRPAKIEIEASSINGEIQRFSYNGLLARAVQHEMDHLRGISFIDRISDVALLEMQDSLDELVDVFESNQRLGFALCEREIQERIRILESERT